MVSSHDDDARNPPFLVADAVEDVDGVALRVSGELDILTVPQLVTHLQHCFTACAPGTALVVDLSRVSFLASTGIAALITAAQDAEDRGCRFAPVAARRSCPTPLPLAR